MERVIQVRFIYVIQDMFIYRLGPPFELFLGFDIYIYIYIFIYLYIYMYICVYIYVYIYIYTYIHIHRAR